MTYLRGLGLTGPKSVCGEGACGTCSVLLATLADDQGSVDHLVVNACTTRLASLHGASVTTVEGVGGTGSRGQLHPVQERLYKGHGSQCGFCSPGMVMAMVGLLKNCPTPDIEDVANGIKVGTK